MPNLMVPVGETHELSVSETLCRDTVEYMLGGTLILNNGRIDKFLFDGGYFKGMRFTDSCDLFSVYFYNRDHLGNNRETLDGEGNVVQVTNYYPFGAPFSDDASSRGTGVQQYKYNGKELDMTHGLNTYDYGARQYYAPLATWDRMDRMAEEYYWMTPYAYCGNNPIRNIDYKGLLYGDFYKKNGNKIGTDGINDNMKYLVLDKTDAKSIYKNTKDGITINRSNYKSAIIMPSEEILSMAQLAFDKSDENGYEYGFVCATDGSTSQLITDYDYGSVSLGRGYMELENKGLKTSFDVHVHPFTKEIRPDGKLQLVSPRPSGDPGQNQKDFGYRKVKERHGQVSEPSWILGVMLINEKPAYKMVTFYTSQCEVGNIAWKSLLNLKNKIK